MSARRSSGEEVVVVDRDSGLPYSKGLMAQAIMATGLAPARSYELAKQIELLLRERPEPEIAVGALSDLAEQVLEREVGGDAVWRFRQWHRVRRLDRPLVVVLGGVAGAGKSTVATLLAHRLGITRVLATDTIRQVLRAFFTRDFMPAVHYSSFMAGAGVRLGTGTAGDDADLRGFLRQADHVFTAVRAIVERSIEERSPLIVEGVHLVPGLLPAELTERALVVPLMLVVSDEELHRSHFRMRDAVARGPAERYLEHFATIRKLQTYLIGRAREAEVPMIESLALDAALKDVMAVVLDAVASVGAAEQ